jgi:hypothetical protein
VKYVNNFVQLRKGNNLYDTVLLNDTMSLGDVTPTSADDQFSKFLLKSKVFKMTHHCAVFEWCTKSNHLWPLHTIAENVDDNKSRKAWTNIVPKTRKNLDMFNRKPGIHALQSDLRR